jgi:hypothetical protein
VVFDFGLGGFVEEIKADGVLVGLVFVEESGAELDPFFGAELAFEDGFLDADAVVLTGLGDATEAALAGFFDGGDVVGDEDEHGDFRVEISDLSCLGLDLGIGVGEGLFGDER